MAEAVPAEALADGEAAAVVPVGPGRADPTGDSPAEAAGKTDPPQVNGPQEPSDPVMGSEGPHIFPPGYLLNRP